MMNELIRKEFLKVIQNDEIDSFKDMLNKYDLTSYEFYTKESIYKNVAYYNAIKICKYIHSLGLPLDHTYYEFEETGLHRAVSEGHEELATWLLENGASPNGNLLTNGTPLSSAIYQTQRILIRKLAEIDGSPEKIEQGYGKTELILDDPEYLKVKRIIIKLLEHDADPNIMTHSLCKTPLDECYYSNNQEIADILQRYGAGYSRLDIRDTEKKGNPILLGINDNIGQVLSVYFEYLPITQIELMMALINKDTKLKLLVTNGLYKTKLNSELGFAIDTYIPLSQQIIDKDISYSFFAKILLIIAEQVLNSKIELFEGLIIEPNSFPELLFPNNLNALMFINKKVDDTNSIWLLVPIKYPRSRKFNPTTLNKFVTSLKNKKWQKIAYILPQDEKFRYVPIFN